MGQIRIVGESGEVLPPGEVGQVYFAGGPQFEYLNDAAKTASVRNAQGWATYGDIGHVDVEGYLYLSDRRADLILSGGVNIYPREVEDVLMTHPDVEDVAVVGVPDADLGETVKAIVKDIPSRLTLDDLSLHPHPGQLVANDIGRVKIRTAEPLPVDSYADSRRTGSFILIDPADGTTLTAGMVGESFAAPEPVKDASDDDGWDF